MPAGKHRGFVGLGRKPVDEEGGWLTTYGDLVTLLLAFFVMLVAIAQFDVQKFQQMADSMSKAMGGRKEGTPIPLREVERAVRGIIAAEGLQQEVQVSARSDGVAVEAKGGISFLTGSAELKPEFKQFLLKMLPEIERTPYIIAVEGHTDSTPINSAAFPSNWELSTARASSVVRFLTEQGIPPRRFRATGFADALPKRPPTPAMAHPSPRTRR
jgi:chemotaxis protein MotB